MSELGEQKEPMTPLSQALRDAGYWRGRWQESQSHAKNAAQTIKALRAELKTAKKQLSFVTNLSNELSLSLAEARRELKALEVPA